MSSHTPPFKPVHVRTGVAHNPVKPCAHCKRTKPENLTWVPTADKGYSPCGFCNTPAANWPNGLA